ncbi:hypothetical protein IDF50_25780 [Klebsiella pneumoniae]|uniref:hypothetical protein n=1 Tax=Klebsiella pneumoniae TaxID=573 RepID=UPI00296E8EDC|nr:hypothetical protein [Klebsiella pneumoniae]MDW3815813.1 hypothetical protein [Klebsiella pneumoniae]
MTPSNTYLTVSLTGTKEVTSNDLAAVYRDWMSNYLSVAAFAEDYGITIAQAEVTIAKGVRSTTPTPTGLKSSPTSEPENNLFSAFSNM